MADAQVVFAESVAGTTAATTTWVDVATISAGSFTAGKDYVILATVAVRSSSSADESRVRLVQGATPTVLTDASLAWEGTANTQEHQAQWMRRITQPGTAEAVKIQISSSAVSTVTHIYSAILGLKVSDDFTENTDYYWAEDTVDYTLTTTPTAKASETFTPNGTDQWLIIGEMTWDVGATITTVIGFELHDGTSILSQMFQEGEDPTNDFHSAFVVWTGVPSNASKTYSVRPYQVTTANAIALSNRVFALNLTKFAQFGGSFDAAEVTPAASPTFTNIQTVSITPATTGDFVYIAGGTLDVNATNTDWSFRLQDDNSGSLVTDPAVTSAPGLDVWDTFDIIPFWFLKKKSLTSGASRTVNVDATLIAGASPTAVQDRAIAIFSVALAGGGGGVTGTAALTDAKDALAAAGAQTITGTAAVTDAVDVLAAAGVVANPVAGTAALADAKDAMAAAGTETIAGSGALTDAVDVLAAAGTETVAGTSALTDAVDLLTAFGADQPVDGDAALTDANDVLASSGGLTITGTAGLTDAVDILAAAGAESITGAASLADRVDELAATGGLAIVATAALTDAVDRLAASGSGGVVVDPIPRNATASITVPAGPTATITVPSPTAGITTPNRPTATVEV